MWVNFLCFTVLLTVSFSTAFPYYGQPPGKFNLPMSNFQPLHLPWWYEPRMMLPPTAYLPSVFSRCLAAIPKMLALPLMPPNLLLMQRYDPTPPCDPEPEYIIRIYVPEIADQNKPVNVLQQAEEPTTNEAAPEAPVPEKPAEGPQENHVSADEDAVLEDAQKPDDAQTELDAQTEPPQTTPVPEVLKEEEEMTTETPDEDKDISQNKEGNPIEDDEENAPSLVKDTLEKSDELKAAENEIEDVKTQEMKKEKEDKIDEGKVDILKADLYQISDTDQSLTSNSL